MVQANLVEQVVELANTMATLANKVNDVAVSKPPKRKAWCGVPIYDGSWDPNVLASWIFDMEASFDYNQLKQKKLPALN